MTQYYRGGLAAVAAIGAIPLAPLGAKDTPQTPRPTRPNIVFIMSDDHAWQAVGCYGDSRHLLDTPAIDRIAKEGIRFDRCLISNAICGPSRACLLTGAYSHINGFYNNNNCKFDGTQPAFPALLQKSGYQTAIVGKWHLESRPVGFDFWRILPGQGDYYDPKFIYDDGNTRTIRGYVTDIITDTSVDWLEARDKTKPFMLMIHHKAPHRPWLPAMRHLNADGGRAYEEPATLFDDYAGRGPAERKQSMSIAQALTDTDTKLKQPRNIPQRLREQWDAYYGPRNEKLKQDKLEGNALTSWKYQRYMHDYLATLRSVDESVAKVLDYLDRNGLAENTLVIYTSDQGFFMGEHGWFDKRWIFEESMRTPMVARWPGVIKPGSTSPAIVSNIDFAQTFLDMAGAAAPDRMQGRSLLPILNGRTPADWRKSFYYEYYEYPVPHRVSPHYGIVTDRYKLVHFHGTSDDYWELFDLKNDPREMRSVLDDPAYKNIKQQLETDLAALRRELKVPEKVPANWFGRSLR